MATKDPKRAATRKKTTPKTTGAKPDTASRGKTIGAVSTGAAILGLAAGIFGLAKLARRGDAAGGLGARLRDATGLGTGSAEHVPTDLMGDTHPGPDQRATPDFRPDPTAPVPASERDAFRPALAGASAPTLVKGQAAENERLDARPS